MNLAEVLNLQPRRRARPGAPSATRVVDREHLLVDYRTDAAAIRALLPQPLRPEGSHTVSLQFIATPAADGRGADIESRIAIPAWLRGTPVEFVVRTFVDDTPDTVDHWEPARRSGRSRLVIVHDTLTGVLESSGRAVAVASMGYKHQHFVCGAERLRACPAADVARRLARTQLQLRRIVGADGRIVLAHLIGAAPRVIKVKGAWAGPAELYLPSLAGGPLPVREVLGGVHLIADLMVPAHSVVVDCTAAVSVAVPQPRTVRVETPAGAPPRRTVGRPQGRSAVGAAALELAL